MKIEEKMQTVNEVSRLTGVSVRTLHYYDEIGLLSPDDITDAGYRLYGQTALARLQTIMLFRELKFPLKEIKRMLDSPEFDETEALQQQIKLLEMQKERLGELIMMAQERAASLNGADFSKKSADDKGGKKYMAKFDAFDKSNIEKYEEEVRQRWGDTQAYQEYKEKSAGGNDMKNAGDKLMVLFAEMGAMRSASPKDSEVQEKIAGIQAFITANFYNCTKEIFAGLGEMYAADERFKANINKAGGEGTAEFVRDAIRIYCGK